MMSSTERVPRRWSTSHSSRQMRSFAAGEMRASSGNRRCCRQLMICAPRWYESISSHVESSRRRRPRCCFTYSEVKHLLYSALTKLRKPHVALSLREYMEDDE